MKLKDWLIPQDKIFFQLLDEHFNLVVQASSTLHRALSKKQFDNKVVHRIEKLEQAADKVITEVFNRLNATFLTPIDHEDLDNLIIGADDLIDLIQASTRRMYIYRLDGRNPALLEFVRIVDAMIFEAEKLVHKIKRLDQAQLQSSARKIHLLENQADDLLINQLGVLLKEKNIKSFILKKEVFEILETLCDKIEEFCNLIQKVVMKNL